MNDLRTKMGSTHWLVSLPLEGSADRTWSILQDKTTHGEESRCPVPLSDQIRAVAWTVLRCLRVVVPVISCRRRDASYWGSPESHNLRAVDGGCSQSFTNSPLNRISTDRSTARARGEPRGHHASGAPRTPDLRPPARASLWQDPHHRRQRELKVVIAVC